MNTRFLLSFVAVAACCMLTAACPRPDPTPATGRTVTVGASTNALPNRVVNGPVPGCADAFELVGQTLALPSLQITPDVGSVVDRIGIVTTGAVYSFSTRPVNPLDCSSTTLPTVSAPPITFGFNYLGDFSRVNPLCMNASNLTLTGFVVSGTPADALIEPAAHLLIWLEVDRVAAGRMHSVVNGGTLPATADPRCSNWVDLATLPPPPSS